MAFRRFNGLSRHLKHPKHRNLSFNKQNHALFTQRLNSLSTSNHRPYSTPLSHRTHIFRTPYSSRIHSHYALYSKCFNLIYRHIQRNSHSHLHQSSSFFNLYKTQRQFLNHYHRIFKRHASMDVSKDYYNILGVNKNAPKKDIRASYLKLAKKWHPDLHKNDKDKETARNKFIEVQEAYEVLHDDGMRKKYDEMRRYGYTQDQYKQQEAYNKYRQGGYGTPRGASPYGNAWEDEFRQNMQREWEKIRREQQDWASQRRAERHQYQHEFPFGSNQNMRGRGFGSTPFGFGPTGGAGPWGAGFDPRGPQQINPMGNFFRIMLNVFLFFMIFRVIGILLFGPREPRQRYDPRHRFESPYYDPRHNPNFPPPYSLQERRRRNSPYGQEDESAGPFDNEYDRDRKLRRGRYVPPPPPPPGQSPRPKNSLKDPRGSKGREDTLVDDDGTKYTFSKPSDQQTTDISSPEDQRRRMKNQKRSKYERMLEEQRMMEEVYIKARQKQMQDAEYQRQRDMNKRFGRRGSRGNTPPPSNGNEADTEDVNTAWERYLNSNSGQESSWRDRGKKN